jgi:hypothetical protein
VWGLREKESMMIIEIEGGKQKVGGGGICTLHCRQIRIDFFTFHLLEA